MALSVTPNETFAVLVGVERYAGDWKALDGPANDAARFAEWLCKKGVPSRNIYLCISLYRERSEYAFPEGCHFADATLPSISNVVKHVIPTLGGKGLFFLWGGHGIIDDDRERHLFLSDAASDLLEAVAFQNLLRFLRSTRVKGFERQWFVIDTCANRFRTSTAHLALTRLGLPDLMDAHRHTQYVMLAASLGEKAENLSAERKGLFSGEVLEALMEAAPDQEWPPNMDAVAGALDARLKKRGAQQSPEYRWYKLGDRLPTLYGSVHAGEAGTTTPSVSRPVGDDSRSTNAVPMDAATPPVGGALTPRELDVLFEIAVIRDAASADDLAQLVLQADVLGEVTNRVVRTVVDELKFGRTDALSRRSLLRLRSYEFVQAEQRQRLLEPVVRALETEQNADSASLLRNLITATRREAGGCAVANLVNLLATVPYGVESLDLSGTVLRDVDFRMVSGRNVDLRGSDLEGAAFKDAFTSMLAVDFSLDGRLIATANADGVIRVSRVDDARQLHAFTGHTDWAWAVAFSPTEQILASSSDDRTVRVWDLESGLQRHLMIGHDDWVRTVAFSPDGSVLASGSQDGTIRLWDVLSGTPLRQLLGHQDQVWSVAFSPNGKILASGSGDGTVCMWGLTATVPIQRWEVEGGRVFSVAFSRDGNWLATAGDTREVRVWNAQTGQLEARLRGHERRVWCAVFGLDGDTIVSSGEDNNVRIWNWRRGTSRTLRQHKDWVRSVAHHPTESWVASASDDQSIIIMQATDGRTVRSWHGWSEPLAALAFAKNSALFTAGRGGVDRHELGENSPNHRAVRHENRVWTVAVSDAADLGASAGDDEVLRLWAVDNGEERGALVGHDKPIWAVAFSPAGDAVATASEDRTARIWDIRQRRQPKVCEGHTSWVRAVAFAPAGSLLATGSDDRTVRLWSTAGDPVRVIEGHDGRVWTVAFHPESDLLASGGDDGVVRVWRVAADSAPIELSGHGGRIWSVAFSPDGKCLATASSDRTVRIWDVVAWRVLHVLHGHSRWVRGIAFSPDGTKLASASEDGTVRLWNGRTFAFIRSLARPRPYEKMLIKGARGLSGAQREALVLLGAVDEEP